MVKNNNMQRLVEENKSLVDGNRKLREELARVLLETYEDCPFCGGWPNNDEVGHVWCITPSCPLAHKIMEKDAWQAIGRFLKGKEDSEIAPGVVDVQSRNKGEDSMQYSADALNGNWPKVKIHGRWVLARPKALTGVIGWRQRLKDMWTIFRGKGDVVVFEEQ